jgi:hypothetical protein
MVRLQEPAPARAMLLGRGSIVSVPCEEDNLVFVALEQIVLFGQAGKYVGKERVEVGFVRVGHGGRIEDEDRPALLGRDWRAVEDRGCGFGHVCRVVGTLAWWRHS